jgi:hypothetical protein
MPLTVTGLGDVGRAAVAPAPAAAPLSQIASMSARCEATPATVPLCAACHWATVLVWSRPLSSAEPASARTRSMPSLATCTALCLPDCALVVTMLVT